MKVYDSKGKEVYQFTKSRLILWDQVWGSNIGYFEFTEYKQVRGRWKNVTHDLYLQYHIITNDYTFKYMGRKYKVINNES